MTSLYLLYAPVQFGYKSNVWIVDKPPRSTVYAPLFARYNWRRAGRRKDDRKNRSVGQHLSWRLDFNICLHRLAIVIERKGERRRRTNGIFGMGVVVSLLMP